MIESLKTGLQLTALGMGLVFLLLAALWGLMALLLKLDRAPAPVQAKGTPAAASRVPEIEPDLVAAITVAVMTHQSVRRKQAAPAMRAHQPGELPSRWVGAGRARQNQTWTPSHGRHPGGK